MTARAPFIFCALAFLIVLFAATLSIPHRTHAQQNFGNSLGTGLGLGLGIGAGSAIVNGIINPGFLQQAQGMFPSHIASTINWASPGIANFACMPYAKPPCPCGFEQNPKTGGSCTLPTQNRNGCPCLDPRGVTGICAPPNQCRGMSFMGLGGQSMGLGGAPGGVGGE